jgi:hypothetical protein
MHDLGEPRVDVPLDWPSAVIDVYLAFDGGRLFGDSLSLAAIADAPAWDERGRLALVDWLAEPIEIDRAGKVWRADAETGEDVCDGTAFDRWLHGAIDATALLFDDDGEWKDEVFTEDGELTEATAVAMAKAQVRRDPRAPGPRWRLARALTARGDLDTARAELEEVVAARAGPGLGLARSRQAVRAPRRAGRRRRRGRGRRRRRPGPRAPRHFLAEAARLAALPPTSRAAPRWPPARSG